MRELSQLNQWIKIVSRSTIIVNNKSKSFSLFQLECAAFVIFTLQDQASSFSLSVRFHYLNICRPRYGFSLRLSRNFSAIMFSTKLTYRDSCCHQCFRIKPLNRTISTDSSCIFLFSFSFFPIFYLLLRGNKAGINDQKSHVSSSLLSRRLRIITQIRNHHFYQRIQ